MILFLLIWNRLNITCSNQNCCFRYFSIRGTVFSPGSPFSKPCPAVHDIIQFYNYYLIKVQIRSLCMVAVASTFLCILYRKWSSEKFQEEQFNEIFGIASSDGDICILRYNISVGTYHHNHIRSGTQLFFSIQNATKHV